MRTTRALLVAVTTTAALLTMGGTASAAPSTYAAPWAQVNTVTASSAHGGFAMVTARYRCYGGDVGTHLFIAIKQGTVSVEHSSTEDPAVHLTAFYSTNWNSDGPSLSLHCDGASHMQSFRLKNQPGWNSLLTAGTALVQFCLFDSTGSEAGAYFDYSMKTVRLVG
jgi:hypothetical protein